MPALDPATPPIDLLPLIGPPEERTTSSLEASPAPIITEPEALAYCRGLATSHYENFSVLSRLVPVELRDDFAAVYAFCRWSDDLGDETGADEAARARSLRLLTWWRTELRACFDLNSSTPPAHPVYIALRRTLLRHQRCLTIQPFLDLIDAFEQDQRITEYQTWDQLLEYCRRSANPVGRLVLALGGYAPPEIDAANADRYRMSDATCTALQLINFWQDVRRDLIERNRIYLPSIQTGVTPDMLRDWMNRPNDPRARVPFIRALRPLVDQTAELFALGRPLPASLDPQLAPIVRLFGLGGEAILSAVLQSGCTTLWARPRIGKATKAWLLARAMIGARLGHRSATKAPPHAPAAPSPAPEPAA